jgi:hypothetical protein
MKLDKYTNIKDTGLLQPWEIENINVGILSLILHKCLSLEEVIPYLKKQM